MHLHEVLLGREIVGFAERLDELLDAFSGPGVFEGLLSYGFARDLSLNSTFAH